jgi:DNA polymerase-1
VFNDAGKRFYGKTLNFSVVYGAGPELVAEQAGWTKKQAKEYLAKYFEVYFRLRAWIDMMYDLCEYEKEAWTMFGRRRPLPGFDSGEPKMIQHAKREAVSTIIQGSSSEVVKCGMIKLEKALRGSDNHLILQVHDEVVIEANEKEQDEVVHLINELLPVRRNSDDLPMGKRMSIDLPVEIEVGPNWKDTRVVEAR